MIKAVKGRQLLVFGLVGLVVVAGYIRWASDGNNNVERSVPASGANIQSQAQHKDTEENAQNDDNDYFTEARRNMDNSRSESLEILQEVIDDSKSSNEAKAKAETAVNKIASNIEKEAMIEGLIKAKGYKDAVVFIDENGVNVVVKCAELETSGVAQITDIVISKTGFKSDKIKITAQD